MTDYNNFTLSSSSIQKKESFLTFNFLTVEERPLLDSLKAGILTLLGTLILSLGIFIQTRIYFMLRQQKRDGTAVAIDRLFKTNNIVNILCQPTFLIYLIASYNLFPMIDYIGLYGCIFLPQFLQVFMVLYFLIFPLTIATVRFLFVLFSMKVKAYGMNRLVNTAVVLSVFIPLLMTLSLQYPVSDYIHGPFSICKGRFEVFFNPTHPDPITPGNCNNC